MDQERLTELEEIESSAKSGDQMSFGVDQRVKQRPHSPVVQGSTTTGMRDGP